MQVKLERAEPGMEAFQLGLVIASNRMLELTWVPETQFRAGLQHLCSPLPLSLVKRRQCELISALLHHRTVGLEGS